ncbi:hypothetical protein V1511DRAFT_503953 [Dipodascopsis uninucleata]
MAELSKYCPISDIAFENRDDVETAFRRLFDPLSDIFSEGCARVRLEHSASFCDVVSADLEGFSRPLWGLVPYAAGGGKFEHWSLYHKGLSNGTNPDHSEYWGEPEDLEQRLVEFAAIGFALAWIPEQFYDPIPDSEKVHIKEYLLKVSEKRYPVTNWKWFHVFLTTGLRKINANYDHNITERNLHDMDTYYLSDGWYGDGPQKYTIDYYNPWAFHFYGIMYRRLCPEDTERSDLYVERARLFTKEFKHWFADDGGALPYGRSLTYKFCCGSFWGALAFADLEFLPWGVIKGLYLRHLRWWAHQPFSRANTGIMSMGFSYPNQIVCERYNCPGSPYWGFKIFLPLALGADHPFWTAKELPMPMERDAILKVPGMVISQYPKNTIALVSGPHQQGSYVRFQGEKYCKFAYSTRYGFSVEVNDRSFDDATLDNMIGFSEDGMGIRIRTDLKARISGKVLYSSWYPWSDVSVQTWIIPKGQWHIRVHKIASARNLISVEGGFAIPAMIARNLMKIHTSAHSSCVVGEEDFSGIVDLTETRSVKVNFPEPNTNMMFAKTAVPQLRGDIKANEVTTFACAVIANPDISILENDWRTVPDMPTDTELQAYLDTSTPVLSD